MAQHPSAWLVLESSGANVGEPVALPLGGGAGFLHGGKGGWGHTGPGRGRGHYSGGGRVPPGQLGLRRESRVGKSGCLCCHPEQLSGVGVGGLIRTAGGVGGEANYFPLKSAATNPPGGHDLPTVSLGRGGGLSVEQWQRGKRGPPSLRAPAPIKAAASPTPTPSPAVCGG